MQGNVKWQVTEIFKVLYCIGQSRHVAKEKAAMRLTAEMRPKNRSDIGKEIGIYSYKTLQDYRAVVHQAFTHAKKEHGLRDITKFTSEHIQSFLEAKITQGIKASTLSTYGAALEKFEQALNTYAEKKGSGNSYAFSAAIADVKAEADLQKGGDPRGYDDPKALISKIKNHNHKLAAEIQHQGGNRIREVGHIKEKQLAGFSKLPDRGEVGKIELTVSNTKGGKGRAVFVSKATYRNLENAIKSSPNKEFRLHHDSYRQSLQDAAEASGQKYTGLNGLRWNYAQEDFKRHQKSGINYEQALARVSLDMGHARRDITEHYLR